MKTFTIPYTGSELTTASFQSPPKGVTVPYTPLKAVSVAGLNGVGNLSSLPLPTIFPTSLASQAILPTQAISQAQVIYIEHNLPT